MSVAEIVLEWLVMMIPYAAGPIVALAIGVVDFRRWRLPSVLLMAAAGLQATLAFFPIEVWDVRDLLDAFAVPKEITHELAVMATAGAEFLPLALLLWAVICRRRAVSEEKPVGGAGGQAGERDWAG